MRVNQNGKKKSTKFILLIFIGLILIVVFSYYLFSVLKQRNGYLVWTSDAVLYTELNYQEALKTNFSNPKWGTWFYVEQDSRVNAIYEFISKDKQADEILFQRVEIKYFNFLCPYPKLPTHIENSYISKIYIFDIRILN